MTLAELLPARWRLAYVLSWTAVALSLSVAALQDYRRRGGAHDWEPFLWEFSSVVCVAVLALGIHALVGALRGRSTVQQFGAHALGLLAYAALHIAGMFGIRFAVYAWAGESYQPGEWTEIGIYESAKDAVSYASFALISRGLWATIGQAALARELAEARLARLADQVQPHFLFNTLNLVSSVMYEDVPRADRLLCQLADLLRQTLAAQQRATQPLAEELALVAPFLTLMQERFGPERLVVRIDADPAAQRCELPALLLLAPVENAVKHDVARHRGRVEVVVTARREGDELRVEVLNLNDATEPVPVAEPREDSGQGLRNLRERLAAAYGARARVEFGPVAGGMRLALSLPAVEAQP
jgi:hypothetical protein